ncbi:MAG: TIGR01777 family oxidoreductase [SAR324 cluster bacterium]|nr:TIGR01777 family oxidoreductase [SAR324 cluster bacterium]
MKKNKILCIGATGFIGSYLVPALREKGFEPVIFSRRPKKTKEIWPDLDVVSSLEEIPAEANFHAFINLAGAGIADKRWTDERKKILLESRIDSTSAMVALIERLKMKPEVVIQGSAMGWYPFSEERSFDESEPHAENYLGQLCSHWESAAGALEALSIRTCFVRTSLVLDASGGALKKMLPPFKLGLGGKLGHGKQWMSWIHLDDQVGGILHLLNNPNCQGAFNFSSPEPVTNRDFTELLGAALGRPTLFPVPALALKLALGEMSCLLLQGQRLKPTKLLESGYHFQYPSLKTAFSKIFKK